MGFKTFEPYAKVSVINEFLGSYQITTDQTGFFPTLSGAAVETAAGLTARLKGCIELLPFYFLFHLKCCRAVP